MSDLALRVSLLTTALMLVAGVLDSLAFTYSASIWREGKLIWPVVGKAGLSFSLGIATYWLAIRYLGQVGVVMPEIQTLIWFAATIIGVMVLGGRFPQWAVIDQAVAVVALASLGWLIVRTSA